MLLTKKDSDFFHNQFFVISSEAGGEVEKSLDISRKSSHRGASLRPNNRRFLGCVSLRETPLGMTNGWFEIR
ncbi:MAG: hypothetical protein DME76_09570 [Verrucomicrobia bacterium]|nr:MAG: hypothetical protein DME76_09570 [Verrucomicrobiota bacterium]